MLNPARLVGNPVRTVVDLIEPVRSISLRTRASVSFVRSGETALDDERPRMPPGRVEHVPGAGDLFFRDTGPPRGRAKGTLLLLHGWMVPSDPHWFQTWWPLHEEGWRVIAMDARGHGRGLRPAEPFSLLDCSRDAAALLRHLDPGPAVAVGYSMGGTIAQILARDFPELLSGAVFCATGCEFNTSLVMRSVWSGMGLYQWWLRLAPQWSWEAFVQLMVQGDRDTTAWLVGELRRGAASDIAEAGREIGRFDSREWIEEISVPTAVLVTTVDVLVPPARQRDLARRLGAPVVTVRSDHLAPATTPDRFHRGLVRALEHVERSRSARRKPARRKTARRRAPAGPARAARAS